MNTTHKKNHIFAGVAVLAALGMTYIAIGTSSLSGLRGNLDDGSVSKADTESSCKSVSIDERTTCDNNYASTTTDCNRKHDECKKDYVDINEVFACDAVHASCVAVTTSEQSLCFERVEAKLHACLREVQKPEKCESEFSRIIQECLASAENSIIACDTQFPESPKEAFACKEAARPVYLACTEAAKKAMNKCFDEPTQNSYNFVYERNVCRLTLNKGLHTCNEAEGTARRVCKKRYPDEASPERAACLKVASDASEECKNPFREAFKACMDGLETLEKNQNDESINDATAPADTHSDNPPSGGTNVVSPISMPGGSISPQPSMP